MIVPTLQRPRIHCSPDVLYSRGVMPKTAEIAAMQRIAKERPDLARKVLQGQELTLISGRGDEFTVSVGEPGAQ